MPYATRKVDGYQVKNVRTGRVHAKSTSKAKAEGQVRLLRGIEHGMVPRTTSQAAGLGGKGSAGAKRAKAHKGRTTSRSHKGRSRK